MVDNLRNVLMACMLVMICTVMLLKHSTGANAMTLVNAYSQVCSNCNVSPEVSEIDEDSLLRQFLM